MDRQMYGLDRLICRVLLEIDHMFVCIRISALFINLARPGLLQDRISVLYQFTVYITSEYDVHICVCK